MTATPPHPSPAQAQAQATSSGVVPRLPTKAKSRQRIATTQSPDLSAISVPIEGNNQADNPDLLNKPEAPRTAPLDLRLPRGMRPTPTPRNAALDDSRSNSARATLASAIAAASLDGTWAEERLGPDTVRFRRGNSCIDAHRPRIAALDPMGAAARAVPWALGPSRPCR